MLHFLFIGLPLCTKFGNYVQVASLLCCRKGRFLQYLPCLMIMLQLFFEIVSGNVFTVWLGWFAFLLMYKGWLLGFLYGLYDFVL